MRSRNTVATFVMALAAATASPASASDHFDGPAVLADPAIDITDMYVFKSPQHTDRLVLVMDVYPNAGTSRWFSNALEYRFRLRPVTIAGTGPEAGFNIGKEEVAFSCSFTGLKGSSRRRRQYGRCITPHGKINLTVGQPTTNGSYRRHGARVFAGLRLDPFFMDVPGYIRSMKKGTLDFIGKNSAENKNALSIVMEINTRRFLPNPQGMYGVVSEIRTRGKHPVVLDTFGRPEVANVILANPSFDKVNHTIDVRDLFNRYDPFGKPGPYAGPFRDRFSGGLHQMDKMDGRIDWPLKEGVHPLTALQLADFTVIDISKSTGMGSWFEIERAIVEGRPHTTGGGRWLDDDICDIQYTFLVARDREKVSDGVDRPTRKAAKAFPYLRKPSTAGTSG